MEKASRFSLGKSRWTAIDIVKGETIRAAAERTNDDGSIDVLVAMRVKTSNSVQQDQPANFRLRVKMAPDGGVYKIAKLDQVSK